GGTASARDIGCSASTSAAFVVPGFGVEQPLTMAMLATLPLVLGLQALAASGRSRPTAPDPLGSDLAWL
ncbi:MAG TPA: hypothetical protein VIM14_17300, partial [Polyangia bacterium]